MSDTKISLQYDNARDCAVVAIASVDGSSKVFECGAATLEKLIQELGKLRAKMKEQVPVSLSREAGRGVPAVYSPALALRPGQFDQNGKSLPSLAYRHPGFGWQALVIPPNRVRSLGEELIKLADSAGQ